LPVLIELPPGNWQTKAPGAQAEGNRIILPLAADAIELSPAR
jgi:hypothetical protein